MKIRPKPVTPTIPKNTAVPSAWRSSAPAPVASSSGTLPRMKAKLVIRIGRSRSCAARTAASIGGHARGLVLTGELDDQDRVLRGERDQHDQADLRQHIIVHARAGARRPSPQAGTSARSG